MLPSMTKKDLAEAAGYSVRQLQNIDLELPEDQKLFIKAEGGKYSLPMFVQRWVQYKAEKGMDTDFESVKAKHEAVKMQKSVLELGRMRGKLLDAEDVRQLWGELASLASQRLQSIAAKVAPRLVMMEQAEVIEGVIDAEVRDALVMIADAPMPQSTGGDDQKTGDCGE